MSRFTKGANCSAGLRLTFSSSTNFSVAPGFGFLSSPLSSSGGDNPTIEADASPVDPETVPVPESAFRSVPEPSTEEEPAGTAFGCARELDPAARLSEETPKAWAEPVPQEVTLAPSARRERDLVQLRFPRLEDPKYRGVQATRKTRRPKKRRVLLLLLELPVLALFAPSSRPYDWAVIRLCVYVPPPPVPGEPHFDPPPCGGGVLLVAPRAVVPYAPEPPLEGPSFAAPNFVALLLLMLLPAPALVRCPVAVPNSLLALMAGDEGMTCCYMQWTLEGTGACPCSSNVQLNPCLLKALLKIRCLLH